MSTHPDAAAVAAYGLPGSVLKLPCEPLAGDEWGQLLAAVEEHGLTGLLQAAADDGAIAVTAAQREEVAATHLIAMVNVLLLERSLLSAVEILTRHDISVRVLKGSAVAHLDYSDPSLRPFGDVDLLVESSRFDDAVAALVGRGFVRHFAEPRPGFDRRYGKGATLSSPEGYELDLHRTFVMGPFGLTLDVGDLWRDFEMFEVAGTKFAALAPEARVLHACYHSMLGNWPPRLQPLRDVAEMSLFGRYDDARLHQLAQKWRCEAVLARAVLTAWQTLRIEDVTSLSVWARRLKPDPDQARHLAMYQRADASYAAQSLASLSVLPSLRDKSAFLRALAVPSSEFLADHRRRGYASWLWRGVKRGLVRRAGVRHDSEPVA